MDIQAAELAELLKLAGVQKQPEMEVEVPNIEPELDAVISLDDVADCTDAGEVAMAPDEGCVDCELDELKQTSADTKLKNPSKNSDYKNGPVSARDDLVAAYNAGFDSVEAHKASLEEDGFEEDVLKPTGGMSYDDPEMRDELQARGAEAAADQQSRDEWDAEQEFLASIGAQFARPDGEDMQQRGQDHSYDYETNPEDFADDDMMQQGTRVAYRDEDDYITPQEEGRKEEDEFQRSEEERLFDEADLQNGYDEHEQIDGDDYGRDNDEYTTPVDNYTKVREGEQSDKEKYPGSYNQGVKDGKAGKKCSNVSDVYAYEGGAYNQGYSDGEALKETAAIHESLVYKYRDFKNS